MSPAPRLSRCRARAGSQSWHEVTRWPRTWGQAQPRAGAPGPLSPSLLAQTAGRPSRPEERHSASWRAGVGSILLRMPGTCHVEPSSHRVSERRRVEGQLVQCAHRMSGARPLRALARAGREGRARPDLRAAESQVCRASVRTPVRPSPRLSRMTSGWTGCSFPGPSDWLLGGGRGRPEGWRELDLES